VWFCHEPKLLPCCISDHFKLKDELKDKLKLLPACFSDLHVSLMASAVLTRQVFSAALLNMLLCYLLVSVIYTCCSVAPEIIILLISIPGRR
jgi:hypothetical protein